MAVIYCQGTSIINSSSKTALTVLHLHSFELISIIPLAVILRIRRQSTVCIWICKAINTLNINRARKQLIEHNTYTIELPIHSSLLTLRYRSTLTLSIIGRLWSMHYCALHFYFTFPYS